MIANRWWCWWQIDIEEGFIGDCVYISFSLTDIGGYQSQNEYFGFNPSRKKTILTSQMSELLNRNPTWLYIVYGIKIQHYRHHFSVFTPWSHLFGEVIELIDLWNLIENSAFVS